MRTKKILAVIYILLVIVMAMATILGKYTSLEYVSDNIFGAWWFCLLWAAGTAVGIVYFIRRKIRRPIIVTLHLSFVIILLGALLTHLTAHRGMIHLRQGKTTQTYITKEGNKAELPFGILLNKFNVTYHAGNMAAMDYASHITIIHNRKQEQYQVSMNNIYSGYGTRLYQSSYDEDLKGSYLSVNSDPYGIPMTYTGYSLLFFALIAMLVDSKGKFRRLLRKETMVLLMLIAGYVSVQAQPSLRRQTADEFGKILIVYNGRICPVETYAIDFTKKLYGKKNYKDFTPCQVLTGFMFWGEEWMKEPILRLKGSELRSKLNMNEYIAPINLFGKQGYILGPYLQDAQGQENDNVSKQLLDTDDKMMLLMNLTQAKSLKIFPYMEKNESVDWFSPNDKFPASMSKAQQQYIRSILPLAAQLAKQGKTDMVNELIQKLRKYQYRYGGNTIPSNNAIRAENIYNKYPFTTLLFIFNLTAGLLSILFFTKKRRYKVFTWLMALSWIFLTFTMALRWMINGTIPLANGYETMLLLSWIIMLVAVLTTRKMQLMTTFGLLMSGFMLLVSHLGEMDPSITPRMPVLNSPLLSIHVSIIMISYALLSLTFICAITYFCTYNSKREGIKSVNRQLTSLSQIFLYPAITTLGLGIFIGAIWANISWGNYWGWDPKETWALITFMIYAIPIHSDSFSSLRNPKRYHLFMLLSFLSILMTYFGVNYILGGMHSYA
ncbi:cytochrome c biogenesis protein CcsA [Prevotella melaninogenica]|uniref:cytochrome c biogenesis protein CcsA n=1 Tax=Prevotella TaxID=838 RepID=UPI0003AD37F8|nr:MULTISPECIES: cytochrome c biogenesis protein CcsA [Prevotella]ERJ79535.1 putative cytochrome c-type biogenesis protein CcsB [Prevotella sp. F0091]QUB73416.1 cytochrome c biogenesis protein CcsA [Prevotella melaninogenica]